MAAGAALGSGAGALAGGAVVLYWAAAGISMHASSLSWMAGGDMLYPALRGASVLRAVASIAGLSTLAALYPAFTASRLEPREALHHA